MEVDEPARKRRRVTPSTQRAKRARRVSPLQALKRDLRAKEATLKKRIRELKKELTVVSRDRKRTGPDL